MTMSRLSFPHLSLALRLMGMNVEFQLENKPSQANRTILINSISSPFLFNFHARVISWTFGRNEYSLSFFHGSH